MRAELVAVFTALDEFTTHEWVGSFTDSLSSLQAIRDHSANLGTHGPQHYHHN